MNATISATEVRNVQECIVSDVRPDGRTLLQRRPLRITTSALNRIASEEGSHHGSSVELRVGNTTVLAAASPSVVAVPPCDEEDGSGAEDRGRGQLFIHIDAVPAVLDFYAHAVGGKATRYRRDFLEHVALTIRHVFGAEAVTVQDQNQSGVAEAQVLEDEKEEGDVAVTSAAASAPIQSSSASTGFPAADLYVGKGYGFRIDVDVHVLQAEGGSVVSCIAQAVHCALRSIKLPAVTLHEGAGGVSVEVDRTRPFSRTVDWTQLPVLLVFLLSPTHHYVVDATPLEELALPQQLHVAADRDGRICYTRYHQYPSRRGNVYALGGQTATVAQHRGDKDDADEESEDRKRQKTEEHTVSSSNNNTSGISSTRTYANTLWMNHTDTLAAVQDAVHICRAILEDCDAALARADPQSEETTRSK